MLGPYHLSAVIVISEWCHVLGPYQPVVLLVDYVGLMLDTSHFNTRSTQ